MKFFILKKTIPLQFMLLLLLAFSSCKKEETYYNIPVYGPDQVFYTLSDNTIARYNASDVRTKTTASITGLAQNEKILSIDFRPATGELYGVSNLSKLFVINTTTGAAIEVSSTPFTPIISGTMVSLDFNPTLDRIRIVTNTGQNLRLNPETGMVVATDTNIGSTGIVGISYTNSYAGAMATTLYDIDEAAKKLYKQDPPNNGTLVEVGNLSNLGAILGFDISPNNSNAFVIGKVGDSTKLYALDLTNGKTTLKGKFIKGTSIQSIAIPSSPVFYATDIANNFLIYNPEITNTIINKPITGLQTGETIVGMDMRPKKGQIYALGSTSRLYIVNIGTGQLTQIGAGPLSTLLNGTSFGFDFNPIDDVIRVVSNTGQNLRIDPNNATVTVDPNIITTTANLSAAAFSSNFSGALTTVLYVLDHTANKLYTQEPLTGKIVEIGDLKVAGAIVTVSAANGFDIISNNSTNQAYGIFTVGTASNLYLVDLSSGTLTLKGSVGTAVTSFTLGLRF